MIPVTLEFKGLGSFGSVHQIKRNGITRYYISETMAKEANMETFLATGGNALSHEEVHEFATKLFNLPKGDPAFNVNVCNFEDKERCISARINRIFLRYHLVDHNGVIDLTNNGINIFYEVQLSGAGRVDVTRYAVNIAQANAIYMFACFGVKQVDERGDGNPEFYMGESMESLLEFVSGRVY